MTGEHGHLPSPSKATPAAEMVQESMAPKAPVPLSVGTMVVGHVEDRAEVDADRRADAALQRLARVRPETTPDAPVTRGSRPDAGSRGAHGQDGHRDGVDRELLRRSAESYPGAVVGVEGGPLGPAASAQIDDRRGRGRPLEAPVLRRMQAAFSADLSGVRIHDDVAAARLNRMVSARAFTTGRDVFFGAGEYAPTTPDGERVLAHELAHTLQPTHRPGMADRHAAPVEIHRMVKVAFEQERSEYRDEIDPAEAKIESVLAKREGGLVATEDAKPSGLQNQHVTADTVSAHMWVEKLPGKTWYEAWEFVADQFRFLQGLLQVWTEDPAFAATVRKGDTQFLADQIAESLDACTHQHTRGGHSLKAGVWAAKLKAAGDDAWEHYDHQPADDEVDPTTHEVRKLKPRLSNVEDLNGAIETWMQYRARLPWTSIEAKSFKTGDGRHARESFGKVEGAREESRSNGNAAPVNAIPGIAANMLANFDVFPGKTFNTAGRTISHAAGIAARHVVEYFQYHPDILPAWRPTIRAAFLDAWHREVEENCDPDLVGRQANAASAAADAREAKNLAHEELLEAEEAKKTNGPVKRARRGPSLREKADKLAERAKVAQSQVRADDSPTRGRRDDGRTTAALEHLSANWVTLTTEFDRLCDAMEATITNAPVPL